MSPVRVGLIIGTDAAGTVHRCRSVYPSLSEYGVIAIAVCGAHLTPPSVRIADVATVRSGGSVMCSKCFGGDR